MMQLLRILVVPCCCFGVVCCRWSSLLHAVGHFVGGCALVFLVTALLSVVVGAVPVACYVVVVGNAC